MDIQNRQRAQVLTAEAFQLVGVGQLQPALTKLGEALSFDPDFGDAHQEIAVILTKMGHPEAAYDAAKKAHACEPGNQKFFAAVQRLRFDLGRASLTGAELEKEARDIADKLQNAQYVGPLLPSSFLTRARALAVAGESVASWERELDDAQRVYSWGKYNEAHTAGLVEQVRGECKRIARSMLAPPKTGSFASWLQGIFSSPREPYDAQTTSEVAVKKTSGNVERRVADLLFHTPNHWRVQAPLPVERSIMEGQFSLLLDAHSEGKIEITAAPAELEPDESLPGMETLLRRRFPAFEIKRTGEFAVMNSLCQWGLVDLGENKLTKCYLLYSGGRRYWAIAKVNDDESGQQFLEDSDQVIASARQREPKRPIVFVSYSNRSVPVRRFMEFALRRVLESEDITYFDFNQHPIPPEKSPQIAEQISQALAKSDAFLRLTDRATGAGVVKSVQGDRDTDWLYEFELPESRTYSKTRDNRVQILFPDAIGILTPVAPMETIELRLGDDVENTARLAVDACLRLSSS